MTPKKHLSFKSLRKTASACFLKMSEHRQHQKVDYSIHDAFMSGFACMYFQDPSLLQFQERLQKKRHQNNLQTLFGVKAIPESTQLRSIMDNVESPSLSPFFKDYFHQLQRGKYLKQYELLPGLHLIALDATQFFSSTSVSCAGCLQMKHSKKKNGKGGLEEESFAAEGEKQIHYAHKVLQIAMMHPDMRQVIPLMPEEIHNSDGKTKQDCEMNAAKRLIPALRKTHPQLGIILTGDDLFSRQPVIEDTLSARMHFIFVAKPDSHKYLMEWINTYPKLHETDIFDAKKGVRHHYEWMNQVPLHGGEKAIQVNYFHYYQYKRDEKGGEIIVYQNSWVTDIEVTEQNVATLAKGGRCKWKIENECFNTLKNQGYYIDHNYGHGEKNLCFNFYLLTLMAFSFHQVFELTDKLYQACRKALGSKKNMWEHLRAYLRTWVFASWEFLLNFTMNPENYLPERPV